MGRPQFGAMVVVALVVLSGCSAPVLDSLGDTATPTAETGVETDDRPMPAESDSEGTETPSFEDEVEIEDGSLDADADVLFGRVEAMIGEDVEPNGVRIADLSADKRSSVAISPVHEMLGIGQFELNQSLPAGYTLQSGAVVFDPAEGSPAFIERRLVHEFVHVVQVRSGMLRGPIWFPGDVTTDFVLAYRSVAEGGAVWVTDRYAERYMSDPQLQSEILHEEYRSADPAGNRLVLAPYHFGYYYVDAKIDRSSELGSVYEEIPETSEQVLHNDTGGEEPMPLEVDVDTRSEWEAVDRDRMGEMFLRLTLRAELSRDVAAEAAAGWGSDRFVIFSSEDSVDWGAAWVTRWDSPTEAREFERAVTDYFEARRAESTGEFQLVMLSDDTIVLLVGDDAFVDTVRISGSGESVSVTVDEGELSLDPEGVLHYEGPQAVAAGGTAL